MKPYLFVVLLIVGLTSHAQTHEFTDECTTATESVSIAMGDIDFQLTPDSVTVSKGACVAFTLINNGTVDHIFSFQRETDSSPIEIPVNDGQSVTVNIQMPDADVTIDMFCAQTGHKEAGEIGEIKVGNGSPVGNNNGDQKEGGKSDDSPGIPGFLWFFAIPALLLPVMLRFRNR